MVGIRVKVGYVPFRVQGRKRRGASIEHPMIRTRTRGNHVFRVVRNLIVISTYADSSRSGFPRVRNDAL